VIGDQAGRPGAPDEPDGQATPPAPPAPSYPTAPSYPPPPPPDDWRSSPEAAAAQVTAADRVTAAGPPNFASTAADPFSALYRDDGAARAGDEWQRPSPRLWSLRVVELLTVAVVALIAVLAALSASQGLVAGAIGAAVVIVVAGLVLITLRRRVSAWGYAERDDDLLVRRGVLFRRLSVIPYGRMQFVDVTAGPFERMFGLATVRMHTAAAASDARIPGLGAQEAARLRDQLTALGEAQAAGL
jgi:membrane protein YdbS with pleckstrin-like domain